MLAINGLQEGKKFHADVQDRARASPTAQMTQRTIHTSNDKGVQIHLVRHAYKGRNSTRALEGG